MSEAVEWMSDEELAQAFEKSKPTLSHEEWTPESELIDSEWCQLHEPCLGCNRRFRVGGWCGFEPVFGASNGYVLCERCTLDYMPGGWQPTWWRNNAKMHWQPFRVWLEEVGPTPEQAVRLKDRLWEWWSDGERSSSVQFWLCKDYMDHCIRYPRPRLPGTAPLGSAEHLAQVQGRIDRNGPLIEAWAKLLEQYGVPRLDITRQRNGNTEQQP